MGVRARAAAAAILLQATDSESRMMMCPGKKIGVQGEG